VVVAATTECDIRIRVNVVRLLSALMSSFLSGASTKFEFEKGKRCSFVRFALLRRLFGADGVIMNSEDMSLRPRRSRRGEDEFRVRDPDESDARTSSLLTRRYLKYGCLAVFTVLWLVYAYAPPSGSDRFGSVLTEEKPNLNFDEKGEPVAETRENEDSEVADVDDSGTKPEDVAKDKREGTPSEQISSPDNGEEGVDPEIGNNGALLSTGLLNAEHGGPSESDSPDMISSEPLSFVVDSPLLRGVPLPSYFVFVRTDRPIKTMFVPIVTLEGPSGLVSLTHVGFVFQNATFLVSIKESGKYVLSVRDSRVTSTGVAVSPFQASVDLLAETCDCPMKYEDFRKLYQCSEVHDKLMDKEFSRWEPKSISEADLDRYLKRSEVVKYVIADNKMWGNRHGKGESWRIREMVHSVLRRVHIPNTVVLISGSDYAVAGRNKFGMVFSANRKTGDNDLLWPTPQMWKNWKVSNHIRLMGNSAPWSSRRPILFFRGANTGGKRQAQPGTWRQSPRWAAAIATNKRPDLTDVKIWPRYQVHPDVLAEAVNEGLTIRKFQAASNASHKYLLQVDGNTASWRLPTVIGSGPVLFKQESPWQEWWTDLLQPMVHYVPVERDFSDVIERVEYAIAHDKEMQDITHRARRLVLEQLRPEDMYCWIANSLYRTHKYINFEPAIHPNMTLYSQPPLDAGVTCSCTA